MPKGRTDEPVLVAGLGRFGIAVARTLTELGIEVLGIDADERLIQEYADVCTHVARADTTDPEALEQLGARDFPRAVVAIGSNIEASVLTTAALLDIGAREIWAKAVTDAHGRILERVGAHHVVFPERQEGERVAHAVTGRMIDYLELDDTFALAETVTPQALVGKTLEAARVRATYGVTVVCIKPAGATFTFATPATCPGPDDLLVVAGDAGRVEEFARQR